MSHHIECHDSLVWLRQQTDHSIPNIITGLPDANEVGMNEDPESYIEFFQTICELIFRKVCPQGYCIFIQTDRKIQKQIIDKSYLITSIADQNGIPLRWHKIVCQRDVGKTDLFRPTYSHFLCYSQKGSSGAAFPDVLPVSEKLYENGMPLVAAECAIDFVASQLPKQKRDKIKGRLSTFDVVDPFVGRGTVGYVCIQKGLNFLGIDIDPQQCESTEQLLSGLDF